MIGGLCVLYAMRKSATSPRLALLKNATTCSSLYGARTRIGSPDTCRWFEETFTEWNQDGGFTCYETSNGKLTLHEACMKNEECTSTEDLHSFRQPENARPLEYGCHAGSAR